MPVDKEIGETQQVLTIRNQSLAQLVELRANPKPSYSLDGQRVSWQEYIESLQQTVDWCDQKLVSYQPFECRSQGTT